MADQQLSRVELSKQIEDLRAVLQVSRELVATTDLPELLRAVERAAVKVLECRAAHIVLYDGGSDRLLSPGASSGEPIPVNDEIVREVVRTARAVHVGDAAGDGRFASGSSTLNLSAFPLLGHDGEIVGVLEARDLDPLDPWDLELVRIFDAHVGVALQRQLLLDQYAEKRRIERDLRLARSIQQGLLPEGNPVVHGFDIAGWNCPADDTGGDFWDHLELDHGALATVVADATGHGIGPALVMASCRASLRATLPLSDRLDEVADRVNRLLCEDLADNRSVTAFIARLTPRNGSLHYLSAGQAPLILYTRLDDRVTELPASAVPLGFFPDMSWPSPAELTLAEGDMMVVVTDGFFEWRDPHDEEYGIERLAAAVRRHRDLDAAQLIRQLHDDVLRFVGSVPQSDDLTALVIKRCAADTSTCSLDERGTAPLR
jgi:phosphoserine phosphatase